MQEGAKATVSGDLWQKYEVVEEVDENGRESTLRIRHRDSGEVRALRTVLPDHGMDPEQRAQFRDGMESLRKIQHPHVVDVYEVSFSPEGQALLVSENIEGTTSSLEDFCDFSRLLPISRVLQIAIQSLEAISNLHDHGLVHRMLSPRSLLLTQDLERRTQAKIIDLDLATAGRPLSYSEVPLEKAKYASPEELVSGEDEHQVTLQSATYSWAVIIYQLLTGSLPIQGEEVADFIRGHALDKPLSFKESDPLSRVQKDLRKLMLAALNKDPKERPSGSEILSQLRALQNPGQVPPSPVPRRLIPAAIFLGLLVAAIYFLWPLLGSGSDPETLSASTTTEQSADRPTKKDRPASNDRPALEGAESGESKGPGAEPSLGPETDDAIDTASRRDNSTEDDEPEGEGGTGEIDEPASSDAMLEAADDSSLGGSPSLSEISEGLDLELSDPDLDARDPGLALNNPAEPNNPAEAGDLDGSDTAPNSSVAEEGSAALVTPDVPETQVPETQVPGPEADELADSQIAAIEPSPIEDAGIEALADEAGIDGQRSLSTPRVDELQLKTASGSSLLLKVVGLSDNIPIVESPGGTKAVSKMEALKSYFVFKETAAEYQISSSQEEDSILGFVSKNKVEPWNTREGLHFVDHTFRQDRRAAVAAWDNEPRIRRFAKAWDDAYGPTYKEELQTRLGAGARQIIPYPLLDVKEVAGKDTADGKDRRIHEVLIPAKLAAVVETSLSKEQIQTVAGAVTFCVVFDATQSMGRYAKDFAGTIEDMLKSLDIDTRLASAGFVLFRDLKNAKDQRFEIAHPMALDDATSWLRQRVRTMVGGDDAAEPVLDAVVLAQKSFLWNGGTAIRGARRIVIVVANEDAKPQTVGLASSVPDGLEAGQVATQLLRNPIPISVFALQAGNKDGGNLLKVMRILADSTGGELYPAAASSSEISSEFSKSLKAILKKRLGEGQADAQTIAANSARREGGGTVIALDVLDEDVKKRLEARAADFHIADGGLVINKAWVFEDPNLYSEKILIEKDLLEWLVRFFNAMADSSVDAVSLRRSTASLLEALIGEKLEENAEVQELLEKRLGIHFTTNLLSFELEQLASFSPEEKSLLQEQIQDATGALADFLDMNARHFNKDSRIWMPVSYLP